MWAALFFGASLFLFLSLGRLALDMRSVGALVCAGIAAVVTTVCAIREKTGSRRHWDHPLEDLVKLLSDIRAGEAPIHELYKTTGRLAPLASTLADLLHDLRRQELANARLDQEMSQRVANRTDALQRSLSSMKNQAQRDHLTGLYNRRALEEAFPRVIDQCRSAGADLFVLMIDLDRFKQVNDQLGHAAGDALIADVGDLIRSAVRQTDLAFRFGGDEFTILLPGADQAAAQALADRLTQLGMQLGQTLKIRPAPGLSVGMSSLRTNPSDATPIDLMKAADASLYKNKTARRSA